MKKIRSFTRKYLPFICMLLFACFIPASLHAEESIDAQLKQQERKYDELRKKIAGARRKIFESNKKAKKVTYQIDEINKKIDDTKHKVAVVTKDIKKVEGNIVVLNNQIVKINQRIAECEEYLRKRVVIMYKYGSASTFTAMLYADGVRDAMDNFYLLRKIAKQDEMVIHELDEQKQRLSDTHAKLDTQKTVLKEKNQELNVQHSQLKTAVGEREIALKEIQKEKAIYIAQEKEFERIAQALQGTINRLIAAKRAKNKKSSTPTVVYYKGGRLMWPIQGRISSQYGTRVHPIFKTKLKHSGLDIAAPTGTPIGAAAAGEVLFAGTMRGYGNVVILDHGGDLTTVYGHMSRLACSENQKVGKGSIIGYVGSTGISTGPHLHFEVRVNGNTVDPMGYLK